MHKNNTYSRALQGNQKKTAQQVDTGISLHVDLETLPHVNIAKTLVLEMDNAQ